jgi:regulator of replication initiation timing
MVTVTVQDGSAEQAALIAQLRDEVAGLRGQIGHMTAEADALRVQNAELATLAQSLRDANAALRQENSSLRDQLTDALARVRTLEGLVSDALRVVEADLRASFSDAQFMIGGATLADRLNALVAALLRLEKGRQLGIYTGLGGSPGAGR